MRIHDGGARHGGEEFVFVLRGSLELHFEDGKVFSLNPGDSLYFRQLGRACLRQHGQGRGRSAHAAL